ncbi:hypothetical protein C8Q73DRAFT_786297 [Cubamyces lactineus]|nr:hypothetical protein C8Q73DRAFT_786297 [Cubamyces lactineus]
MPSVFDLPYDVLREIFTRLSAVDVLNFLRISRKLYYPLIDDDSTWYIFCAPYGITDTSVFRKRSFRIIYGRLLHRYGALLGLWCSDYPFKGNIVEFRIVPDKWLRRGEPIIVGDVWEFSSRASAHRPYYPVYLEFMQIGFIPWKKSTLKTANDVQISWHVRSERDLGFLVHNGIPPPWVRMDGDGRLATPSLHVMAPTSLTLELGGWYADQVVVPEMLASAPWYDANRGVPRLPQEADPPPIMENTDRWYIRPTTLQYVPGLQKPAAIAFFPPPNGQQSDVRIPDLHNPPHYFSSEYKAVVPRYYPLRQPMLEGDDPASPQWRPESIEGLWLGDYGVHGTECLFLEYAAEESAIRAWKITGDSHVPRGACSWDLDLRQPASDSSPSRRSYEGRGTLAQRGFRMSEQRPVRITIAERDLIVVSWEQSYNTNYIRYRQQRGRVGDS